MLGAPSGAAADAPTRRAPIAAHNAALPPPITSTSNLREKSTMRFCYLIGMEIRSGSRPGAGRPAAGGGVLRGDGFARFDGLAAAIDGERCDDAQRCAKHQPVRRRGL